MKNTFATRSDFIRTPLKERTELYSLSPLELFKSSLDRLNKLVGKLPENKICLKPKKKS